MFRPLFVNPHKTKLRIADYKPVADDIAYYVLTINVFICIKMLNKYNYDDFFCAFV